MQQQYMYTMHESVKHVLKAVGLHDNDILLMHVWNMLHTGVSFDTLAKFMVYAIYPSYMYTDIMQYNLYTDQSKECWFYTQG